MKGISLWALMLTLLFPSFSYSFASEITNHNVKHVTAGVVSNFPPQYSLDDDGNPQGFAIDSMNAIAEIAGVSVDYKVYDHWGDLNSALRTGEVDLIPNNGITNARREYSDFSQPIETFAISVFVRKDSTGVESLVDLKDTVIGVVERNAAVLYLEDVNYQTQVYPDFSNLLIDLVSGRIDAAAYPEPVVWKVAQETGLDHRIRSINPPLIEIKRGLAFPKGHTNLISLFEPAISQFIVSEDYERIYNKWHAKPKPFWNTRKVITLLLTLSVIYLFVASLWRNYSLSKINTRLKLESDLRDQAERDLKSLNVELEEKIGLRTEELAQRNRILNSIDHLREQFIKDPDPFVLFPELLENLLQFTDSQFGFIGDVLLDQNSEKYLKVYAISSARLAAGEANPEYYNLLDKSIEIREMDDLIGEAVRSGNPFITNNPKKDSKFSGSISKYPAIHTFMEVPVYFGSKLVGVIGLANRKGGYNHESLQELRPVIAALGQIIVGRWDKQARLNAECELKLQASTDSLTGVSNRRSFELKLTEEVKRANRYNEPLSLIMLDIDHFKQVNDKYGHDAGDTILIELVEQLQIRLRETDFLARWGGEEFMIILPSTSLETGVTLAERLREVTENYLFTHQPITTISLGVTTYQQNEEIGDLISRTDKALYEAKHSGRNQVAVQKPKFLSFVEGN
jgi:diguanylate cyclase (GGDEF)-like protein